jgi:prepilin-type N-terminal cleavage/methylation domain-containing protein/prepilin-type processing-associated H-X9-DG protein
MTVMKLQRNMRRKGWVDVHRPGPSLHGLARRAFSLTELLVSISIIGVILAIALPAIQRARESARMSQCKNNLKQLALACEEFKGSFGHYPTGQLFDKYGSGPDSTAWSFLARLLPFLEQTAVYKTGNIPNTTLRDSGVAAQKISVFLCPTDPYSNQGPRMDAGNMVSLNLAVGQTNYKGCMGANWGADESQGWEAADSGTEWPNVGKNGSYDGLNHGDGMLYRVDYRSPRRDADVTDGLSNTFLLGEALPKYDIYCSWPYTNNTYSTCAIPMNINGKFDPRDWPNAQSFRSEHSGGANFVFGDGTIRFINQSIDLNLYRGLATINGQESISPP